MISLPPALPPAQALRDRFHRETVEEVAAVVARDKVVVVGMAWNGFVKKARRILQAEDIGYTYLE